MSLTDAIEDYLLLWVLLSVAVGLLIPSVSVVTRASTLVLAVMIGSISLTLTVERFGAVGRRGLAAALVGHLAMPFLGYGIAVGLGLSSDLTTGFVVLGAVTPEPVTPVMTELAGGDTALSTAALVLTGIGSLAFVPAVLSLLGTGTAVPTRPIVEQLVVAVVVPMDSPSARGRDARRS